MPQLIDRTGTARIFRKTGQPGRLEMAAGFRRLQACGHRPTGTQAVGKKAARVGVGQA
jgi:hypothetical protein